MWHWWIPDADGPLGNIAQAAKPGHCAHPTPPLLPSTLPCHVQTYIGFVRSTILTLVSGKCFCLSFVPSLRELSYTQFTWEMVLRVRRKEWCEGTEVYCQDDFWAKVGKLAVPRGIFGKHTDYPRTVHQKAEDWRTCLLLLSLGDDMVGALILPLIDHPCKWAQYVNSYVFMKVLGQNKTKQKEENSFLLKCEMDVLCVWTCSKIHHNQSYMISGQWREPNPGHRDFSAGINKKN